MSSPFDVGHGHTAQYHGNSIENTSKSVCLVDRYHLRRRSLTLLLNSATTDMRFFGVASPENVDEIDFALILLVVNDGANRVEDALLDLFAIRKQCPAMPVAIFVQSEDVGNTMQLLRGGFAGVISVSLEVSLVLAALHLICCGGTYMPHSIIGPVHSRTIFDETRKAKSLTKRELEILDLLREGKPNKVIAHRLSISECTVKVHLQHMMRKMKATNRTEVALMQWLPDTTEVAELNLPR